MMKYGNINGITNCLPVDSFLTFSHTKLNTVETADFWHEEMITITF